MNELKPKPTRKIQKTKLEGDQHYSKINNKIIETKQTKLTTKLTKRIKRKVNRTVDYIPYLKKRTEVIRKNGTERQPFQKFRNLI